jgi:mRNA-degrading endonuclease RelE of RelBE toxin-antitoxin system
VAYTLKFTDEGRDDVRSLLKATRNWLKKELRALEADPIGCSFELHSPLQGYRSFHCGEYRAIFMVFEHLKAVSIVAVGKHSSQPDEDVYKHLETLAKEGKLAEKLLISIRGFSPGR